MPVARIISSSFEDALKFAEHLRPIFDTVEIAQPGRTNETAVDLEVNLEICTSEQAWKQVAEFGKLSDADIFAAPEALTAGPPVSGQETPEMVVAATEAEALEMPEEFEVASREAEMGIAQASAEAETAAGSNGSAHAVPASESAEDGAGWLGRTRESLRQWLAVRALLREIREMEQQRRADERQQQRQMALQFERKRREQETRKLAPAWAAEQQQLAIRETGQHGLQEQEGQHLEEQTILHIQAQEEELRRQAEQEEAIRRGLFVEEILRRRAQEQPQPLPLPAALDAEPVPLEFEAVPPESFAVAGEAAPAVKFVVARRGDRLKPAMALAGVTSVLLMAVLVGYAHRRPASPVPLAVLQRSNAVEQKVPFGPAVLPAPMAAAAPIVAMPLESAAQAEPAPARHSFRRDFRRVRVGSHEVDYVADDVTVRHFNYAPKASRPRSSLIHRAAPASITASRRDVKQISDME